MIEGVLFIGSTSGRAVVQLWGLVNPLLGISGKGSTAPREGHQRVGII